MQIVTMNVTQKCVNKCPGCYAPRKGKEMSVENFEKIIKKIPPNINSFVISGGEPFMHSDLDVLVRKARTWFNGTVGVFTSGVNGKNENYELEDIAKYVDMFNVTLKYPYGKYDNEWFKNMKKYDKSLEFLEECNNIGVKTNIHFAVDRRNIGFFYKMVALAREYHSELHILRYLPFGLSEEELELALSDWEWDKFCKEIYKIDGVRIVFPSDYSYRICTAGVKRMHIFVNGDVSGCIYLETPEYVIGNLLKQDFKEIIALLEGWRSAFPLKSCIAKDGLSNCKS